VPPGDGVSVTPADLIAHAGHVDEVAGRIGEAARAGAATAPGPDAYGRLCVLVPLMLGQLQGRVVDGIEAAERSLRDTSDRLRASAAGYRDADRRAAGAVDDAGRPP
jgi:hypothetical protein